MKPLEMVNYTNDSATQTDIYPDASTTLFWQSNTDHMSFVMTAHLHYYAIQTPLRMSHNADYKDELLHGLMGNPVKKLILT